MSKRFFFYFHSPIHPATFSAVLFLSIINLRSCPPSPDLTGHREGTCSLCWWNAPTGWVCREKFESKTSNFSWTLSNRGLFWRSMIPKETSKYRSPVLFVVRLSFYSVFLSFPLLSFSPLALSALLLLCRVRISRMSFSAGSKLVNFSVEVRVRGVVDVSASTPHHTPDGGCDPQLVSGRLSRWQTRKDPCKLLR